MLEIEFEPPAESGPCECCGGVTTSLTRFVKRDGDAVAVYYARFTSNHPDRAVPAVVSLGKWWDGTQPADRTAFALQLQSGEENYEVMVCDAATSPWQGVEILGDMLDREAALAHPLIQEIFHITDHMFQQDAALLEYLAGTPPT